MSNQLEAAGFEVKQAELRWLPGNSLEVSDEEQGRSLLKMMDALEDLDDVQSVTSNFEMSEELMNHLSFVNS